jgi:copper chaperone CopZ
MSLLNENVIPGNCGKIFGTNATENSEMEAIKAALLNLDGVTDVLLNTAVFPKEFTVHTDRIVSIDDVEEKVNEAGFHSVPKSLFEL